MTAIQITDSQEHAIQMAADLAKQARHTLGERAMDGAKARPTLKQINSTLERLDSIQRLLAIALERTV